MSNNEQNNGLPTLLAFFTGFMAGAVIGLLYAPTSGEKTREQIRSTAVDAKNQTVEFTQQAVGTLKEGIQNLRTEQRNSSADEDETTEDA
ncbi:YtxH domain-containing protein [Candidatus Poribacteria bacterium]|nr:YtxH domain-containing protein [Candidatus Poribacteria bacterium]MYK20046.1 YtxH domain-containing protein [Candidatus Poribacteria bacterium]